MELYTIQAEMKDMIMKKYGTQREVMLIVADGFNRMIPSIKMRANLLTVEETLTNAVQRRGNDAQKAVKSRC